MNGNETPGTPLRRVLEDEGRKQSWLAERIGIDPAQLSRIVNGFHAPEATRDAIADALGRETSELFPEHAQSA